MFNRMAHLLGILTKGRENRKTRVPVAGETLERGGDNPEILLVRILFRFIEKAHLRYGTAVPQRVTALPVRKLDVRQNKRNDVVDRRLSNASKNPRSEEKQRRQHLISETNAAARRSS